MSVTKEAKQVLIDRHGANSADTGRTEVQVAILSSRITDLTGHLKIHSKDHSSRRSLLKLVGQRRRLLKYLRVEKLDVYRNLIVELGLRK